MSQVLFSLSPIPGIGMVAAPAPTQASRTGHSGPGDHSCPCSSLFVFNSLLISAPTQSLQGVSRVGPATAKSDEPAAAAINGGNGRTRHGRSWLPERRLLHEIEFITTDRPFGT